MNPQRAAELPPVIQAFAAGKTIQVRRKSPEPGDPNDWQDLHYFQSYDGMEYRIKPVPREWRVLVRDGELLGTADIHSFGDELIKVREVTDADEKLLTRLKAACRAIGWGERTRADAERSGETDAEYFRSIARKAMEGID